MVINTISGEYKPTWKDNLNVHSQSIYPKDPYIRMTITEFSTIILKLDQLGLNILLCNWLLEMLTKRRRVGWQQHTPHWIEGPHKDVCWGPPLHSAAPQLHADAQLKPLHQVNGRRDYGGSHLRWWWDRLWQRGQSSVLDKNLSLSDPRGDYCGIQKSGHHGVPLTINPTTV